MGGWLRRSTVIVLVLAVACSSNGAGESPPTTLVPRSTITSSAPAPIDEAGVRQAVADHIVADTASRVDPAERPIACSYYLFGFGFDAGGGVVAAAWGFCELVGIDGVVANHALRFDLTPAVGGYVVDAMQRAEPGEPEGYPATVRRIFPEEYVAAVLQGPEWEAMTRIEP